MFSIKSVLLTLRTDKQADKFFQDSSLRERELYIRISSVQWKYSIGFILRLEQRKYFGILINMFSIEFILFLLVRNILI